MSERRLFVQAMAKHLPPSSAALRLLDVGSAAGETLAEQRGDLDVTTAHEKGDWPFPSDSFDAVTAFDISVDNNFLHKVLTVLRPGGRFIWVRPAGGPSREHVDTLEQTGFTRILVEAALDSGGVLMRGEKPHTEEHTIDRIRQVAARDVASDLTAYSGRYVHLLIQQTPNKPVWALQAGEPITWRAVTLDGALLAFSSLPKAVAFMQPAVLSGAIKDVNKVAKFSRETAQAWMWPVLLNPSLELLNGRAISLIEVDPITAEAPDE